MAEPSIEDRIKLLTSVIEQSPPGEVNDVINDIRNILDDDQSLKPHVRTTMRTYNLGQLHVVEHPYQDDIPAHSSILSEASLLPGSSEKERFIDAAGKRSFAFDHVDMTVSDYEPYELPEEEETFRAKLAESLTSYTRNHFPSGSSSVSCSQLPLLPPAPPPEPVPLVEPNVPEHGESAAAKEDVIEPAAVGDIEPDPTPAVGDVEEKKEEIEQPGGLEKLDEKVEEVKEEEEEAQEKGETEEKDQEAGKETEEEAGEGMEAKEEKQEKLEEADQANEETADVEPAQVEPAQVEPAQVEPAQVEPAKVEEPSKETELATEPTTTTEPKEEVGEKGTAGPADLDDKSGESSQAVAAPPEPRKQERVENPTYTLEVVGTRYNLSNFWTGKWRTQWVVDQAAGKVDGKIIVDVHYFEQGNVQLRAEHAASFSCPTQDSGSQSVASQIVTNISKIETNFHFELNDVYGELGDKAFRSLRRALPITRQRMEWERVEGYTLGADLAKSRT